MNVFCFGFRALTATAALAVLGGCVQPINAYPPAVSYPASYPEQELIPPLPSFVSLADCELAYGLGGCGTGYAVYSQQLRLGQQGYRIPPNANDWYIPFAFGMMSGVLINAYFAPPTRYVVGVSYRNYLAPTVVQRYQVVTPVVIQQYYAAPPMVRTEIFRRGPGFYDSRRGQIIERPLAPQPYQRPLVQQGVPPAPQVIQQPIQQPQLMQQPQGRIVSPGPAAPQVAPQPVYRNAPQPQPQPMQQAPQQTELHQRPFPQPMQQQAQPQQVLPPQAQPQFPVPTPQSQQSQRSGSQSEPLPQRSPPANVQNRQRPEAGPNIQRGEGEPDKRERRDNRENQDKREKDKSREDNR
jgi:hypothetical protein